MLVWLVLVLELEARELPDLNLFWLFSSQHGICYFGSIWQQRCPLHRHLESEKIFYSLPTPKAKKPKETHSLKIFHYICRNVFSSSLLENHSKFWVELVTNFAFVFAPFSGDFEGEVPGKYCVESARLSRNIFLSLPRRRSLLQKLLRVRFWPDLRNMPPAWRGVIKTG